MESFAFQQTADTSSGLSVGSRCVVTAARSGDASALNSLLGSLAARGNIPGVAVVVLTNDKECEDVAERYAATVLPEAPLHTAGRVIDAAHFVCIDAHAIVSAPIEPLFAAIDVLRPETILLHADGNPSPPPLFAGSRIALLALNSAMQEATWAEALSRLGTAVLLGEHRCPVRIGAGRMQLTEKPIVGPAFGDGYAQFLATLRAWSGTYGRDGLQWSFYATPGDNSGYVRDTSVFPVLALLHYLIRANGAVRVVETGTARGISAACMASAVAHRVGGRVVTFDPCTYEGREELWQMLPAPIADSIEARMIGSLEGMALARDAAERYDAALLDSLHHTEHVLAEFELARALVCPGGLILIHDALMRDHAVEEALQEIERAGYGVARLFAAESGVQEEDRLGLAVIENRSRAAWRRGDAS